MNSGFILIDKEKDWTSRDVCNKLQHLFETRKVGHSGTLDPFATGLLIVSVNNANKASRFLEGLEKTYIAELKLGKRTNTGDLTGNFLEEKEIGNIEEDEIKRVFNSLLGNSLQTPPMTSARKVKGIRLYDLAYQGIEIERKPTPITIFSLELLSFKDNIIKFEAKVSSGTYIRVLGEEIAKQLNAVGYLISLRRTKIGTFAVENGIKIGQAEKKSLRNIDETLSKVMPIVDISEKQYKTVIHGAPTIFENVNSDMILLRYQNEVLAVYKRKERDEFVSERGLQ